MAILGRKGFCLFKWLVGFLFYLVLSVYFLINNPNPNPSRKKVMKQSQDRKWRGDRGKRSYWLPLMARSALLEHWKPLVQEWHNLLWSEPTHIDQKSKNAPTYCPVDQGDFLSWGSLFPDDSSLCQVHKDVKQPSHHRVFRLGVSAWESELDASTVYFRQLWNDTDKGIAARLLPLQCLGHTSPSFEIKDSF